MITAFLGVFLATALFGALMWSIYRAAMGEGHARLIALLLSITTLLGIASISLEFVNASHYFGGSLIVLAIFAIWYDPGWSKLLPLVQLCFGIALVLGLPWSTA